MRLSDQAIIRLPGAQQTMLVRHIDRAVPVDHGDQHAATRIALIAKGLLRGDPVGVTRPRHTVLTEAGRHAVCVILARYADALVAAGFLDRDAEEAAAERLRALRRRWSGAKGAMLRAPAPDTYAGTR